jgi:tRNA G18 (ribose-2'-O)-methylase SpoU
VRVIALAGIDDPRVAEYRSLRRIESVRREGRFVCEGARVVRQLLRSPLPVHSLLTDERWLGELRPLLDARPEAADLPVYLATKADLESIIGYSLHQGVMAMASAPQAPDLLAHAAARPRHVYVALCGVSGAENVGGILRNAAGFGADGVLLDGPSHDPFVRRAARVSVGAVFHVPVWRVDDVPAVLRSLRGRCGTRSVAAHLYEPVVPLDRADLSPPLVVVLGSEATGLSDEVVRACDVAAKIPMHENWGCLNVATAGAVVLWEVYRRNAR